MGPVEYLSTEDLLAVVRLLDVGPIRDPGVLESAAARPRTRLRGSETYPTLALKAAAFLHSLAASRALAQGNKRLAWLATVVFLDLNGHVTALDAEAVVELVEAAADPGAEVVALAERFQIAPQEGR